MANDHQSWTPLVDKDIKVAIRRDGSQRHAKLKIFVGFCQSSSLTNKKELHIRLTDESDPFFLQFLYLGEEDFHSLKSQQGLLVDFSAFPQKFVDLIDLCSKEEQSPNPRFLLQFNITGSNFNGNGQLDVVETNPFKHLIHLSLKFLPGNDEEVKKYLASCIKILKDSKTDLEDKLNNLEKEYSSSYSSLEHKLYERTNELEDLKSQWTVKLNEASSKHIAELSSAKEQELRVQNSYEERLKSGQKEWENKFGRTVSKLEAKIEELEAANKDLLSKKYKAESTIHELKSRNFSLEEECRRSTKEVQTLRRQNSSLDSDRHERDKTLNHLRTRVAVLEQELKDKEQVISKSTELLETSNSQRLIMEEDLRGKSNQISKLDATIKSVSDEVLKGNEIIQKLQNEIRNLKSQVKLKNIVTTKQERIIEEKEDTLLNQKKEIAEINEKLAQKTNEVQKLSEELVDKKQKLEDSRELARTNENVINWLNKQLNDQMLGPARFPPNESTSLPLNSTASRISSIKQALHQSTPSSVRFPSASGPIIGSFQNPVHNQVLYRPPSIRKPPTWQSPPSSESLGVPSGNFDRRPPLRQRMPGNQSIMEQAEPAVDLKYLQRQPQQQGLSRAHHADSAENNENNVEMNARNGKTVKPLLVSTKTRKTEEMKTNGLHIS